MQLWEQLETVLASHPLVRLVRPSGKANGYLTGDGREVVLVRDGQRHVRVYFEPFDTRALALPDGSTVKPLGAEVPRAGIGRVSDRLYGPTEGKGHGHPAVQIDVVTARDLDSALRAYTA